MRSVLIISKKKELAKGIAEILRPFHFDLLDITDSAAEARRRIQRGDFDFVMINTPLSHESGLDLALDILETDGPEVIIFIRHEQLGQAEIKLAYSPAMLITKPINKQLLIRDIRFILNAREKRQRLEKQNRKLKDKMDGLKTLYRAKLMLMGYLDMTEEQAHRYIQKQAMDTRRSPEEVSKTILKMYDK